MFKRLRLRLQDMKTISQLISGADQQANLCGKEEPGAEHFVLSALNLDDGSARRVFTKLGIDAEKFKNAINQQYKDALSSVGIQCTTEISTEPVENSKLIQSSQPSGKELIKLLYEFKRKDKHRPLLSAHVILVASKMEQGIVARSFNTLQVDSKQLISLVNEELKPS